MHQIQQKGIPWETFIAHEVFTIPPTHHQQVIPSSSHPPIPPSPSHPATHASPSTHIPSPHDDPPSLSSHIPSPSSHDTTSDSKEINETDDTKMVDIYNFPLTYKRGNRQVFSPKIVEMALPSSSIKQIDKGKEKAVEQVIV